MRDETIIAVVVTFNRKALAASGLPSLLKQAMKVDAILYDSLHAHGDIGLEFNTIRPNLAHGALPLVDDIDLCRSRAFTGCCSEGGIRCTVFGERPGVARLIPSLPRAHAREMVLARSSGLAAITNFKIVAVTPAGRRAYLDLLAHYVLSEPSIEEWRLWDNCRDPRDRAYIEELARKHRKIRIVRSDNASGENRSINAFYAGCDDSGAFYIKMDDDLVYLQKGMPEVLLAAAKASRSLFLWWSPLVINNAICSWVLKSRGVLETDYGLTAQAACPRGWRDPRFAVRLHRAFLADDCGGLIARSSDATVSLSRFSINCIGFFGEDVKSLGAAFCPLGVDDEEWLSAILPLKVGRFGRIVGKTCVAHYSFFTQEAALNRTNILDRYYELAGLRRRYPLPRARQGAIRRRLVSAIRAIFWGSGERKTEGRDRRSVRFRPAASEHERERALAATPQRQAR